MSEYPRPLLWLMKSEPDVFSIDDLERERSTPWDGVRNYTARNYMRDMMAVGDLVLYYHSNTSPPGIVGLGRVIRSGYPDPTAFDPGGDYFDPKSTRESPRWFLVDLGFVEKFPTMLTLDDLKEDPELVEMLVVQRGQRLSVQPVEPVHFKHVLGRCGASSVVPPGAGSVVGVLTGAKAAAKTKTKTAAKTKKKTSAQTKTKTVAKKTAAKKTAAQTKKKAAAKTKKKTVAKTKTTAAKPKKKAAAKTKKKTAVQTKKKAAAKPKKKAAAKPKKTTRSPA